MEGGFITNQNNRFLSEIINGILPKCDNSCFLVGYFYFSGFVELYEQLRNKNLRVLVGLDIERDMYKQTLFMQLVSDFINKAVKKRIAQIQIKEVFLSENQEATLNGADEKRMWNYENVYYRSTRPIKEVAPARILWYASTDKKSSRKQAIIASSYLDEVMTDKPKILFQKNKHYGIYEWQNIYDLCNNNIENPIRALRFSGTEVFINLVKLSSIREIFIENGRPSNTFASPVRIDSNIFNQIYQAGVREKGN
jgi:hypothetical protein